MYVEGIRNARHFLSSLRVAARMKPVIIIKAGRHKQGSQTALSHTGALVGEDDVFEAALRRSGAVRVMSISELFTAAEILSSNLHPKGNRLAIITNGGGAAVMAVDRAAEVNVSIPELSQDAFNAIDKILPKNWSHHNPIDILGDATPERFKTITAACLKDSNTDGILTILVPVGMTNPTLVAQEFISETQKSNKAALACWMGGEQVKDARKLFAKYKISSFNTPELALNAFSYLVSYYHNQKLLLQVPPPLSQQSTPDIASARLIINAALAEKRNVLNIIESKAILSAFGIPVTKSIPAQNINEALLAADSLGYPVAMKILSADITHKQTVGGVQLNINSPEALHNTFTKIMEDVKRLCPNATIMGVTLESMYKQANDRELMIGIFRDVVFGPVISFGAGGSLQTLSDESKYFRFMQVFHELTTEMLIRFTQIDYELEMALIATIIENNQEMAIGIARYTKLPGREICEFGLVVADAWQHQGLGSHLMESLIDVAKSAGIEKIYGEILINNYKMLQLVQDLGFLIINTDDKSIKRAEKLIV